MNKNKGIATIAILGIILGALIIGGGSYYLGLNNRKENMTDNNFVKNKDSQLDNLNPSVKSNEEIEITIFISIERVFLPRGSLI